MLKLLIAIFIILNTACGQSVSKNHANDAFTGNRDTVSYVQLGSIDKNSILIDHDIDLKESKKMFYLCNKNVRLLPISIPYDKQENAHFAQHAVHLFGCLGTKAVFSAHCGIRC